MTTRFIGIAAFWLWAVVILTFPGFSLSQEGEPTAKKTKGFKAKFIKNAQDCAAEYETNIAQAIALFAKRETDDRKGKCFLRCMLQNYGLMDNSGRYIKHEFKPFMETIPTSNFLKSLKENLQQCMRTSEAETDACSKAYKFCRCFYQHGTAKKTPKGSSSQDVLPGDDF